MLLRPRAIGSAGISGEIYRVAGSRCRCLHRRAKMRIAARRDLGPSERLPYRISNGVGRLDDGRTVRLERRRLGDLQVCIGIAGFGRSDAAARRQHRYARIDRVVRPGIDRIAPRPVGSVPAVASTLLPVRPKPARCGTRGPDFTFFPAVVFAAADTSARLAWCAASSSAKLGWANDAANNTIVASTIFKALSFDAMTYGAPCDTCGSAAAAGGVRSKNNVCSAGTITSSIMGPINMPPTMTVASGRCT